MKKELKEMIKKFIKFIFLYSLFLIGLGHMMLGIAYVSRFDISLGISCLFIWYYLMFFIGLNK